MDSDTLKLLQAEFIENCINIGLVALPLFEYLTTVDQEVELVWRRKTRFSLPSIVLASTRVCMVANAVLTVVTASTCTGVKVLTILSQIMECAGYVQAALFSALRVSALYDRNIALFGSVSTLGLVPVGTNIFNYTHTVYIQSSGTCLAIPDVSDSLTRKLVLATRIPVIVADFLVLTLTWARTYKQILLSRSIKISTCLSTCLARDGALYFLTLLIVNVLQIATFRTHLGAPVTTVTAILPPIFISRFMLNLRQAGSGSNPSDSVTLDCSAPRFQLSEQAVGSMGEPLEFGGSDIPGECDDEVYTDVSDVGRHTPPHEDRQGVQERSAEASGSGAVLV